MVTTPGSFAVAVGFGVSESTGGTCAFSEPDKVGSGVTVDVGSPGVNVGVLAPLSTGTEGS